MVGIVPFVDLSSYSSRELLSLRRTLLFGEHQTQYSFRAQCSNAKRYHAAISSGSGFTSRSSAAKKSLAPQRDVHRSVPQAWEATCPNRCDTVSGGKI
jgi:hypothetical protein